MPDVQLYFHKTAASLHDNSALIFYKYDYGANAQFLCSKKEKSTELKGSDADMPTERSFKTSKLGISALQIFRFECCDTRLARGFHPLNPDYKNNRA